MFFANSVELLLPHAKSQRLVIPASGTGGFETPPGIGRTITEPPFASEGGAVRIYSDGTFFSNGDITYFSNTAAGSGGVICADDGAVLQFTGSTVFEKNYTHSAGGAIAAGGNMRIDSENLFFQSNTAGGPGGAFALNTTATVTIGGNVTADGNYARTGGGGAFKIAGGLIHFSGANSLVTLSNNVDAAYWGGGILVESHGDIVFDGGVIMLTNTSAKGGGGVSANGDITFTNAAATVSATGNTALDEVGGAIRSHGNTLIAGNASFTANKAFASGGAIAAFGTHTYGSGGDILFTGADVDVSLADNYAGQYGGALAAGIALHRPGNISISANNIGIAGNTAAQNGGAAYATASVVIGNTNSIVTIAGNKAGYDDLGNRNHNAGVSGGAIYAGNGLAIHGATVLIATNTVASHASGQGGAIYIASGTLRTDARRLALSGNYSAQEGGAIYAASGVTTIFGDGITFEDNIAGASGGGLFAGGSVTFLGSATLARNQTGGWGGAVYAGGDVNFTGTASHLEITGNTGGWNVLGGGIYSAGNVTVAGGALISSNTGAAYGGGGGIAAQGDITFTSATRTIVLRDNQAINGGQGGALYSKTGDIRFAGATEITGNSTLGKANDAGAIFAETGGIIFGGSAAITGNIASYKGGALYAGGTIRFDGNVTLSANQSLSQMSLVAHGGAAWAGGGILFASTTGTATIAGNIGGNNGGALYAANGDIRFLGDAVLTGNHAKFGNGGAIYIETGDAIFDGVNTTLTDNHSDNINNHGGAIHTAAGSVFITSQTITLSRNTAGNTGGAIYSGGKTEIGAPASTIDISDNTATTAGAIYSTDRLTLAGANITISGNTAGGHAGALYLAQGGDIAPGAQFTDNTAGWGGGGGAIYVAGGTLAATAQNFERNTAGWTGGAVFVTNADANLASGTFANNYSRYGGAIGAQNATVDISGALVTSNSASLSGGAVSLAHGGTFTAIDATFSDNISTGGYGGVIDAYADTAPLTINLGATANRTSTFSGNTDLLGANSINLCGENAAHTITLNVATDAGGTLAMLDPMRTEPSAGADRFAFAAVKTGAGEWTLGGASVIAGTGGNTIDVNGGKLTLLDNAVLDLTRTAADRLAISTGGTLSAKSAAQLRVTTYDQNGGALQVVIGPAPAAPAIIAATATIGAGATLNVANFTGAGNAAKASELTGATHTVIHTTGGITGDYAPSNILLNGAPPALMPDYILGGGYKTPDNLDYKVGYALRWFTGTATADGIFTLAAATDTFDVDLALADHGAPAAFTSGWDGRTLEKRGPGTLILSAVNSYSGATLVSGGTLQLTTANAISTGTRTAVAAGATLALRADQYLQNISGAGLITLGTSALTAFNDTDTVFTGTLDGAAQPSRGLTKTGPGTLDMSGAGLVTISTTAAGNHAVTVTGGTLALGNATLRTEGDNAHAASLAGSGLAFSATKFSITTTGSAAAHGVYVASGASLALDDGTITIANSKNGYGIYADNTTVASATRIVIDSAGSGVLSNYFASVTIAGSTITTHGENTGYTGFNGSGLRATGASTIFADSVKVTTTGSWAYGVLGNAGAAGNTIVPYVTLTNGSEIITTGYAASGVYTYGSHAFITLDDSGILTHGDLAKGVYAFHASQFQSHNSAIATTGSAAAGVVAEGGGSAKLFDTTISTQGADSPGLLAYGIPSGTSPSSGQPWSWTAGHHITGSNLTITTAAANSDGARADNRATISAGNRGAGSIAFTGSNRITTLGATSSALAAAGLWSGSAAKITGLAGVTFDILAQGTNSHGLLADSGGIIDAADASRLAIATTGASSSALRADGAGSRIDAANLDARTIGGAANGVYATNNALVNLTGANRISLLGDISHALYVENNAAINAADTAIETAGYLSFGVIVRNGAGLITLSGSTDIFTRGVESGALYTKSGTIINTGSVYVRTEGYNAVGVEADPGSLVALGDRSRVETTGADAFALFAIGAGARITGIDSDITTAGGGAHALLASDGAIALTGTAAIATTGAGSHGAYALAAGAITLGDDATITTTGVASHGAIISGPAAAINFGAATAIATTGENAHGLRVENGATRAFDGAAPDALPRITVAGPGSAVLNAAGAGSRITLTATQALAPAMTSHSPDTLGAKAENNGVIAFDDRASTGGTRLRATTSGTLLFTGSHLAAAGSRITLDAAGALDLAAAATGTLAIGSLDGDAAALVNLGANQLVTGINTTAADGTLLTTSTYAGRITGATGRLLVATNTLALTGSSDFTGGAEIAAGPARLILANGSAAGTGAITARGVLETAFTAGSTLANTIVGTGTLENTGAATTLTAANSRIAQVNNLAGRLAHAQTGAFATTGDYNIAATATTAVGSAAQLAIGDSYNQDGALDIAIGPANANNPAITALTATLGANSALNVVAFTGTLDGLNKASQLPPTLYTVLHTTAGITGTYGRVLINGGALGSAYDFILGGAFKTADNLDYKLGFALAWFTGSSNAHGNFTLANAADIFDIDIPLTDQTAYLPFGSNWDGKSLDKRGDGTLVLSASNAYTGATTVSAGTLRTGAANAIASSTMLAIAANAAFDTGAYNQQVNNLTGSGTYLNSSLSIFHSTLDTVYAGVITGDNGVVKTGAATLTLTGAGDIGALHAATGTLALAGNARLTTATGTITSAMLLGGGLWQTANAAGAGTLTFASGTLRATADAPAFIANTLSVILALPGGNIDTAAHDIATAATLAGPGGLAKLGSGTLTLSSSNAHQGGTQITAGALVITHTAALGAGAATIAQNAELRVNTASIQFSNTLVGRGLLTADLDSSASTFNFDANAGTAFTGTLALVNATFNLGLPHLDANAGALTAATLRTGTGAIVNLVENTLGGSMRIHGLALDGGLINVRMRAPDAAHILEVDTLAVDHLNNPATTFNLDIAALPVPAGAAANFLDQDNADNGIQVIKTTALDTVGKIMALTLSGSAVSGATLTVNDALGHNDIEATYAYGAVSSGSTAAGGPGVYAGYILTQLKTNTALVLDTAGATDTTLGARITGAGAVEYIAGDRSITLGASNAYTGSTTITSGTLIAGADDALGRTSWLTTTATSAYNLNNHTQTIADGARIDGALLGTGSLGLGGLAAITSANATFAADVGVTGTAILASADALGRAGAVTVAANADLRIGATGTFSKTLVGSGTLTKNGPANSTLTIANPNAAFTGRVLVGTGTLRATHLAAVGAAPVAIANGAAFELRAIATGTFANIINGAGALAIASSTLALGGNNGMATATLAASAVTMRHANALGLGAVSLDSASRLIAGVNAAQLGSLNLNGGVFAFEKNAPAFRTATIAQLGDTPGTLEFNVNFTGADGIVPGGAKADYLRILDDGAGTHRVSINYTGAPTDNTTSIELIDAGTATADYRLAAANGRPLAVGKIDISMSSFELARGDGSQNLPKQNTWYLADHGLSNAADSIINTASLIGADWFYSLDSLHQRMGDLRAENLDAPGIPKSDIRNPHSGNVWLRSRAYRLNAANALSGHAFKQYGYGLTGGADKTFALDDRAVLLGAMIDMGGIDRRFVNNGDGHSQNIGIALYATWLHRDGWYADFTARADRYKNRFDAHTSDNQTVDGRYTNQSQGLSLEAGRMFRRADGWWIEPGIQIAQFWNNSASYDTTPDYKKFRVHIDGSDAQQYRARLRFGRRLPGARWNPYGKFAAVSVDENGGAIHAMGKTLTPDYSGKRIELGFGATCRLDDLSQIYADYEYAKAALYERPWSINLGYRRLW